MTYRYEYAVKVWHSGQFQGWISPRDNWDHSISGDPNESFVFIEHSEASGAAKNVRSQCKRVGLHDVKTVILMRMVTEIRTEWYGDDNKEEEK